MTRPAAIAKVRAVLAAPAGRVRAGDHNRVARCAPLRILQAAADVRPVRGGLSRSALPSRRVPPAGRLVPPPVGRGGGPGFKHWSRAAAAGRPTSFVRLALALCPAVGAACSPRCDAQVPPPPSESQQRTSGRGRDRPAALSVQGRPLPVSTLARGIMSAKGTRLLAFYNPLFSTALRFTGEGIAPLIAVPSLIELIYCAHPSLLPF